ncbi:MAG TPA: hypothetical protein PK771_01895 [Spirochaetota bacterium]|nr:hypothetical protein [Spirochaetota bacterium]
MYKTGYSLPVVIFIIAFLSATFTLSLFMITQNLKPVNKTIISNKEIKDYYTTLSDILEYFTEDIKDNYTSKYNGWFKDLPDEKNGFTFKYTVEDTKIDINHINLQSLKDNKYITNEEIKKYLYYNEEIKPHIKEEYKNKYNYIFSVYLPPNLNLCDMTKLKNYIETTRYDLSLQEDILNKIKSYRTDKQYLTYYGLLINEEKYINLRTLLPRGKEDDLYIFFDYKGGLNINFITEEVFEIAIKLCSSDKNIDYKRYFDIIKQKRENEEPIRDIKEIFGNDSKYYEKIFSVDSSLFFIDIIKNKKELKTLVSKYKNFRGENKVYILRYFFNEIQILKDE